MEKERLIKKKLRAKRNGNIHQLAETTRELGDLYYDAEQFDEALEQYSEAVDAYCILNDKLNCAIVHRMIGEIFATRGEYQSALKHQNLHLEGAQEMKNKLEEQRAFATLGRTYFLLAESFSEKCDERTEALDNAKKAYSKSLLLCDKLKVVSKEEIMTMRARILLNWGLVLEAQMLPNEGIELIKNAIKISSNNKSCEDTHKAHLALGALYERQGNNELAIKHLDLAANVDNTSLKAIALLAKAELFLRTGEWISARKVLVKLYPMKKLPHSTREQIEKQLRIAVTLCRSEEKLNDQNNSENISLNKFKLYEQMGDAATAAQCDSKALKYYEKMLFYAEEEKLDKGIAAALFSIATTFKDTGQYEKALDFAQRELKMCSDPHEVCKSALFIADLLESVKSTSSEICEMYKLALSNAKMTCDLSLEVTVLKEFLHYLDSTELTDAEEIRTRLETIPASESEKENSENPDIGADIQLDELSDLDQSAEEKSEKINRQRSSRNSKRGLLIKKDESGNTQLHIASIKGDIKRVEKLISDGHPINERDYSGWTPLHEAANHGFVEIAKLLINAGADISDPGGPVCEGITPLHDAISNGHFSVVNLLIEKGADVYALTKAGDTVLDFLEDWRKRAGDLSDAEESEYEYVHRKLITIGVPRRKEKRKINVTPVNQNRNRRVLLDENEDDSEDVGKTNISAGEDYKRTIASLRNRGIQPGPSTKSPISQKDVAPLVDSDQVLMEEWLDDDLGPDVNKKKHNLSDPLSTAKRKSNDFTPSRQRENKRQRVQIEDQISSLNICNNEEESSDSNSLETFEMTKQPMKIRKRKRQSSLLSVGFSRYSVSRTPSPMSDIVLTSGSEQNLQATNLSLQVIIKEKKYQLQFCTSNEKKITIESIIQEIQKKFQGDTGCTPYFDLVAPNGDIITSQDAIDALLENENSLTLTSSLKNMDIPLLSDRYRKICNTGNVDIEEGTMKCLKTCENTSIFRLRNHETLDCEIFPLLKSLEYQINLRVLYLSGGELNDVGDTLNQCLAQLSTLQELHLRCCDIDSNCLSMIEKFPSQVKILDLSYNPLGEQASDQLFKLLSPLKNLQTLNLTNCQLDTILLGTSNSTLIHLDISHNAVGGEGLRSLLQSHMLSLNVSNTVSENRSSIVAELLSHPKFSLTTLESLEISSCSLCDSDLSKILLQATNLNKLVVNGNFKLSKQSFLQVLQHIPTISYIDISGCSEITEPPDFQTSFNYSEIRELIVSMAPDVQQSWLKLWNGEGWIQTLPHHVTIFKCY